MKLMLKCLIPIEFSEEIDIPSELIPSNSIFDACFFNQLLSHDLVSEIEDCILSQLIDNIQDIISSVLFAPKSKYYFYESHEAFEKLLLKKVEEQAAKYQLYCIVIDENEKEIFQSEYDVRPLLIKYIADRECDCQGTIDVGSAIISSMEQYIELASWHYGLIDHSGQVVLKYDWPINNYTSFNRLLILDRKNLKPIMWFGLEDEKPEDGWILNMEEDSESDRDWKNFWLGRYGGEEWLNRVPDADDGLLYWMEDETGSYLPSIEDVLKTCPIDVDETDDYATITQKIEDLLDRMLAK